MIYFKANVLGIPSHQLHELFKIISSIYISLVSKINYRCILKKKKLLLPIFKLGSIGINYTNTKGIDASYVTNFSPIKGT